MAERFTVRGALLDVEYSARTLRLQRERLIKRMQYAQSKGASLREIGRAAGFSHTGVQRMLTRG